MNHDIVREIADLGWPPGVVENTVTLAGIEFRFSRAERDDRDEIIAFHYVSDTGRALKVWNA